MARRRRVAIAHPTEKGHTEAGGHGLGAAARTGEDVRVREEAEELGAALAEEAQALLGDVAALGGEEGAEVAGGRERRVAGVMGRGGGRGGRPARRAAAAAEGA